MMWVVHLSKGAGSPPTVLRRALDQPAPHQHESYVDDDQTSLLGKQQAVQQHCSWLTVVVMVAIVSQICSIDRMAMSVAILPMSDQYGWANTVKGAVNGAFNVGYTLTNLFGGYLAAVFGPKRVLAMGVLVWSGFTVLTPLAAATGQLWLLLAVRAIMGVGEGVAFPCVQVLVKTYVPTDRRARSLSLVYSGHQLGSIISLLASPGIIYSFGWSWVFYLYGSLGFVWLAVWQPLMFPAPTGPTAASKLPDSTDKGTAQGELQFEAHKGATHTENSAQSRLGHDNQQTSDTYQAVSTPKPTSWVHVPWMQFLQQPACWALLVAHCSFGVCYNVAMSWLPAYYNSQFHVDVRQSAHMSILPFAVMAVTTNLSGWVADGLINSGWTSTITARKLMQSLGTSVPAICLLHLGMQRSDGTIRAAFRLLTFMLAGLGFQAAGFASNHQDISTRYAGILYGVTNAGSSFAGSVAVYGVGVVLDRTHGSWGAVFRSVAWMQLLSLFVYLLFATSAPLFD